MSQHRSKAGFYWRPDFLDKLIQLVNELPVGEAEVKEREIIAAELERRAEIEVRYAYVLYGPSSQDVVEEWNDLQRRLDLEFFAVAKSVVGSTAVLDFLFGGQDVEYQEWSPTSRYHELYDVREILNQFAEHNEASGIRTDKFETSVASPSFLAIDHSGLIKVRMSGAARLFMDNDVYAENIRRCRVCNKLYWRRTRRSRTCGTNCSNAIINRDHRSANKDRINARRRENYDTKKKLAAARKARVEEE